MKPLTGTLNSYQESDWPGVKKINQNKTHHQHLPKNPNKPHNQSPTFHTGQQSAQRQQEQAASQGLMTTVIEREKLRQKIFSPTLPEQEEKIESHNINQGQPTVQAGWWLQIPGHTRPMCYQGRKAGTHCLRGCSRHWWRAHGPGTNTCPDLQVCGVLCQSKMLNCVDVRGEKDTGACLLWHRRHEESREKISTPVGISAGSVSRVTCRSS